MPNIIEQQDLLKGLPDSRLALLMKSPVGDIPPFLVAAEAQRRQSIRQQFAGDGNKESVVDSLTKALSGVPQNLNVPMQAPPKIPPPMPQAGIGAIQQTPQQAPQQAMAEGGAVRRYQEGGQIQPMWQIPNMSGTIPKVMDWVGSTTKNVYDVLTTPWSDMGGADTEEVQVEEKIPGLPDIPIVKGRHPLPEAPKPADPGKKDTSPENKAKEDELRKRLEDFYYGTSGQSDWEKAQKWFAMSEQFLDPSKTTMQSLAGAAGAFAGGMADQKRLEREEDRAREEALLKYDIDERNRQASLAAQERERTSMSAKDTAEVLSMRVSSLEKLIADAEGDLTRAKNEGMADPASIAAQEERLKTQEERLKTLYTARQAAVGQLSSLVEQSYGPIKFDTFSLTSGFQR